MISPKIIAMPTMTSHGHGCCGGLTSLLTLMPISTAAPAATANAASRAANLRDMRSSDRTYSSRMKMGVAPYARTLSRRSRRRCPCVLSLGISRLLTAAGRTACEHAVTRRLPRGTRMSRVWMPDEAPYRPPRQKPLQILLSSASSHAFVRPRLLLVYSIIPARVSSLSRARSPAPRPMSTARSSSMPPEVLASRWRSERHAVSRDDAAAETELGRLAHTHVGPRHLPQLATEAHLAQQRRLRRDRPLAKARRDRRRDAKSTPGSLSEKPPAMFT